MNKPKYTHIFFDLDHTLWDFDANTRRTFDDILCELQLYRKGIPDIEAYMTIYAVHNKQLWSEYKAGNIEKEFLSYRRFELTLADFGIRDTVMAKVIAEKYIQQSPLKTSLIPGSMEVLGYLVNRYRLGLITNGFNEIQFVKIEKAGLKRFFEWVITSEEAGVKKPDPGIFRYALEQARVTPELCLYVGDEPETDVEGAREAGIDQVLFCPDCDDKHHKATYVIRRLTELLDLL